MGLTPEQIAAEYNIGLICVQEALAFYKEHGQEIDANIHTDQYLAEKHN
jgi:uncharacterized protein (DUF433 family)